MTSGYAIVTLVVFIISQFFVIYPVSIPMPRPIHHIQINLTTAPILAIALLWAAQCLDPVVIRNGIVGTEVVKPYSILILFLSLAYMAITLDITGILKAAAYWVSNRSDQSGWRLYLSLYLMFTLLSIPLGNGPIIITGTAFLVYYTQASRLDWRAWIMSGFTATSTSSMVLFAGNPSNVVICEAFDINNAAFTAYTILPFLACNLLCFATMAFQYRNDIPRTLTRAIHENPWSALQDPFGALVGGIMLGTTLIICLVVSFFGIDAWMISLPFAVVKVSFDVGWDSYRYSHGISMLGRKPPKDIEKPDVTQGVTVHKTQCVDSTLSSTVPPEAIVADSGFNTSNIEPNAGIVVKYQHAHSTPTSPSDAIVDSYSGNQPNAEAQPLSFHKVGTEMMGRFQLCLDYLCDSLDRRFPTFFNSFRRLPLALVPFAFSQFILVEALNHQGWVNVFAIWLSRASDNRLHQSIWVVGALGVLLSSLSGTNIGATILLAKVIHAAALPYDANHGVAISLAVASNIGAIGFTFSASLPGLLWRSILEEKGIHIKQRDFALWNLIPLIVMTTVGLGTVSAQTAVLFRS